MRHACVNNHHHKHQNARNSSAQQVRQMRTEAGTGLPWASICLMSLVPGSSLPLESVVGLAGGGMPLVNCCICKQDYASATGNAAMHCMG